MYTWSPKFLSTYVQNTGPGKKCPTVYTLTTMRRLTEEKVVGQERSSLKTTRVLNAHSFFLLYNVLLFQYEMHKFHYNEP